MSHFYASIQGDNNGEATRTGGEAIEGHVRGWNNGVRIFGTVGLDPKEVDRFVIYATGGSNGGQPDELLGELRGGEWFPVVGEGAAASSSRRNGSR